MTKRTKIKEIVIHEPMYEADISYLYGGSVPELINFIKNRHKDAIPVSWSEEFTWGKDADTTNAYQFHINGTLGYGERFYVWMHQITPSLMFHETFHITGDILHTRGIEYSSSSEEAFAYLGGWIFQEVYKLLKGNLRKK